jgi:hypothetical protein
MHALAQAAVCLPGATRETLRYEWSMVCTAGPCSLWRGLDQSTPSVMTRSLVLLAPGLAGATFKLQVSTQES